jgi:hypothetical protein
MRSLGRLQPTAVVFLLIMNPPDSSSKCRKNHFTPARDSSDFFNLLGVLGPAALLTPMRVGAAAYRSVLLLVGMVLVVVMMHTGWRLSRLEGGSLVGLNLVRWITDFTARQGQRREGEGWRG